MSGEGEHSTAARRPLLAQVGRFGVVGVAATGVHAMTYLLWVQVLAVTPSVSNVLAFVCAFAVSFLGHLHWTFAGDRPLSRAATLVRLSRFALVAVIGLALNATFVHFVVAVLVWPYEVAVIPMILITPPAVFLLGKFWAFRPAPGPL